MPQKTFCSLKSRGQRWTIQLDQELTTDSMATRTRTGKSTDANADGRRAARLKRDTKETQLQVHLDIDGEGRFSGAIGVPFFEHMMDLFARHSLMDIEVGGRGDLDIDAHHTVEDVGIVLGQ